MAAAAASPNWGLLGTPEWKKVSDSLSEIDYYKSWEPRNVNHYIHKGRNQRTVKHHENGNKYYVDVVEKTLIKLKEAGGKYDEYFKEKVKGELEKFLDKLEFEVWSAHHPNTLDSYTQKDNLEFIVRNPGRPTSNSNAAAKEAWNHYLDPIGKGKREMALDHFELMMTLFGKMPYMPALIKDFKTRLQEKLANAQELEERATEASAATAKALAEAQIIKKDVHDAKIAAAQSEGEKLYYERFIIEYEEMIRRIVPAGGRRLRRKLRRTRRRV